MKCHSKSSFNIIRNYYLNLLKQNFLLFKSETIPLIQNKQYSFYNPSSIILLNNIFNYLDFVFEEKNSSNIIDNIIIEYLEKDKFNINDLVRMFYIYEFHKNNKISNHIFTKIINNYEFISHKNQLEINDYYKKLETTKKENNFLSSKTFPLIRKLPKAQLKNNLIQLLSSNNSINSNIFKDIYFDKENEVINIKKEFMEISLVNIKSSDTSLDRLTCLINSLKPNIILFDRPKELLKYDIENRTHLRNIKVINNNIYHDNYLNKYNSLAIYESLSLYCYNKNIEYTYYNSLNLDLIYENKSLSYYYNMIYFYYITKSIEECFELGCGSCSSFINKKIMMERLENIFSSNRFIYLDNILYKESYNEIENRKKNILKTELNRGRCMDKEYSIVLFSNNIFNEVKSIINIIQQDESIITKEEKEINLIKDDLSIFEINTNSFIQENILRNNIKLTLDNELLSDDIQTCGLYKYFKFKNII